MLCSNCGSSLPDNTTFCPACGAAVTGQAPSMPPPPSELPVAAPFQPFSAGGPKQPPVAQPTAPTMPQGHAYATPEQPPTVAAYPAQAFASAPQPQPGTPNHTPKWKLATIILGAVSLVLVLVLVILSVTQCGAPVVGSSSLSASSAPSSPTSLPPSSASASSLSASSVSTVDLSNPEDWIVTEMPAGPYTPVDTSSLADLKNGMWCSFPAYFLSSYTSQYDLLIFSFDSGDDGELFIGDASLYSEIFWGCNGAYTFAADGIIEATLLGGSIGPDISDPSAPCTVKLKVEWPAQGHDVLIITLLAYETQDAVAMEFFKCFQGTPLPYSIPPW